MARKTTKKATDIVVAKKTPVKVVVKSETKDITDIEKYADEIGATVKLVGSRAIVQKNNAIVAINIDKDIYSKNTFISLEELIEKLLCSKLKCFYCKCECELIYENVLSKHQWTLDRIENDAGHNADNVVICCLECNLKRGTMDSSRFKYGKQLKFKKVG